MAHELAQSQPIAFACPSLGKVASLSDTDLAQWDIAALNLPGGKYALAHVRVPWHRRSHSTLHPSGTCGAMAGQPVLPPPRPPGGMHWHGAPHDGPLPFHEVQELITALRRVHAQHPCEEELTRMCGYDALGLPAGPRMPRLQATGP